MIYESIKLISDHRKSMASLAVFRTLYNKNANIYKVISEFIKQVVVDNKLYTFEINQIQELLLKKYGFNIPQAVVKTSIKQIPTVEQTARKYTIELNSLSGYYEFSKEIDNANKSRDRIIKALIGYVNDKRKEPLKPDEIKELLKSFYAYIIDDRTSIVMADYISSFIIANKDNKELTDQLNLIRDGLISYLGLTYYNTNVGTIDGIEKKIRIYLDTDVLFSMAGYNGNTCKKIFDEFYQQVQEINNQAYAQGREKLISLRYFPETKREVDSYFGQAERLVRNNERPDWTRQAMLSLLSDVREPADIREKRCQFDALLASKHITEETKSYSLVEHQDACLDFSVLDQYEDEDDKTKLNAKLTMLNYVYINRNCRAIKFFYDVHSIFLTASREVLSLAATVSPNIENTILLACTYDFVTSRLWFALKKGIPTNENISQDVLTKSRVVLSSFNNQSVRAEYEKLVKDEQDGKITQDEILHRLSVLYKVPNTPEELQDVASSFATFGLGKNIEDLIEEDEKKKLLQKEEIDQLKREKQYTQQKLEASLAILNGQEKEDYFKKRQDAKMVCKKAIRLHALKYCLKNIVLMLCFFLIGIMCGLSSTWLLDNACFSDSTIKLIEIVISILTSCLSLFSSDIRNSFINLCPQSIQLEAKKIMRVYLKEKPFPILHLSTMEDL